jgi:predicted DNA-binding protein YlxM (UPF0122 family)
MLKGVIFSTGLVTGIYLGIYLRQQGLDQNLKRAYYILNKDREKMNLLQKQTQKQDIYQKYKNGEYNEKQFQDFVERAKLANQPIDEIIQSEILTPPQDNK